MPNKYKILVLMEESKLTMLQRKTIQEAVDKGESLPPSIDRTKKAKDKAEDYQVNIATYKETSRKFKIIFCSIFR